MDDDPVFEELLGLIRKHGWAVRLVSPGAGDRSVPFGYTIGLTAIGHPEVVEQGLPSSAGHAFLNLVASEVIAGRSFAAPSIVRDLTEGDHPVAFIEVDDASGLTAVEQVYGHVRALQLVWSDSAGRLPWDAAFGPGTDAQPLLGSWNP